MAFLVPAALATIGSTTHNQIQKPLGLQRGLQIDNKNRVDSSFIDGGEWRVRRKAVSCRTDLNSGIGKVRCKERKNAVPGT